MFLDYKSCLKSELYLKVEHFYMFSVRILVFPDDKSCVKSEYLKVENLYMFRIPVRIHVFADDKSCLKSEYLDL